MAAFLNRAAADDLTSTAAEETASVVISGQSDDGIVSPPPAKRAALHSLASSSLSGASTMSDSGKSNILRQSKLTPHITGVLNPTDCFLAAMVSCNWPLWIAEDPHFIRFIISLQNSPGYELKLSRPRVREDLLRRYKQLKEQLVQLLRTQRCPVSLVLDGWTNVNHAKVTNILLVCAGKAYYWCSITNATERNTAEWITSAVTPVIEAIEMESIPVVSYVADNEAVMSSTHDRLVEQFPSLIRIPCAAHTVQLIVRKMLQHDVFARYISEYIDMLNEFSGKKELRLALHTAQPEATRLVLIRPCDTRWSYTLVSIQRSIQLRNYINQSLEQCHRIPKSDQFWGILADLVTVLKPFAAATNNIQRDAAMLCDVSREFSNLRKHAANIQQRHAFVGELISSFIQAEWEQHVNISATAACAVLSKQSDQEEIFSGAQLMAAQKFIKDWGATYLRYYRFHSAGVSDLGPVLDSQLTDFINDDACFLEVDFAARLRNSGPLKAWASMLTGPKELARVAIALLSICASEAAAERSFSIQDRIHSKQRNRSKEDLVEARVFLQMNEPLLDPVSKQIRKAARPHDSPEELEMQVDMQKIEIQLQYLHVVPAVVLPAEVVGEVMEARPLDQQGLAHPEPQAADIDAVYVNDVEDEIEAGDADEPMNSDETDSDAVPNASMEQEDEFLHHFIETHQLRGKCKIVGDLENQFSSDIETHQPKIKSQLRDLKKRLLALCKR